MSSQEQRSFSVDGRHISKAWQASMIAASDEEVLSMLYRSILIEEFEDGLQLISTDSTVVCKTWVAPTSVPEPGIDEIPLSTFLLSDPDHRGLQLMKFIHKEVFAKDAEPEDVHLTIKQGSDESTIPGLARNTLSISFREERLTLFECELNFVDWRKFFRKLPTSVAAISFGYVLPHLQKLQKLYDGSPLDFVFQGSRNPARIRIRHDQFRIEVLAMPTAPASEPEAVA